MKSISEELKTNKLVKHFALLSRVPEKENINPPTFGEPNVDY